MARNSTPYEDIDDTAADRILSYFEIEDNEDWYDVRKRLVRRFPKWTAYQRDRMAARILERKMEHEEFEAGRPTRSYTKMAVDSATGPGGTTKARYKMVRSVDGKYLGRPGNIKITTRKGSKVYAKNILTGKKGRIK